MLKLPAFCIGLLNLTLIMVDRPATQLSPNAPITETGYGPFTTKSVPFAATELHNIGFLKTSLKISGAQATGVMLSIGVGASGSAVKDMEESTELSQLSSKVLLSLPI